MASSLVITNVKIPRGDGFLQGGIAIHEGRIRRIAKEPNLPREGREVDGDGLVALPGLIDSHVHLRDMELVYKEDFLTGTRAAARGGFTTVLDMPNTVPPTITADRLNEKIERAMGRISVDVGFHCGFITSAHELHRMAEAGAMSFKLYMNKPLGDIDLRDRGALLEAFRECARLGVPVTVHAEDGASMAELQRELASIGKGGIGDFLKVHAERMEVTAVKQICEVAREGGAAVHICHISVADSVKHIANLKRRGHKVTCEVTPHHLLLDDEAFEIHGALALTVPPIRSRMNRIGLWRSLVRGEIDIIASDHAPHSIEEKIRQSIWDVQPGIPGLETTLPILLTEVRRGEISLRSVIDALATGPAEIFGLHGKGQLIEGNDADIVLVDLKAKMKINPANFYSKAKYSPFQGRECVGKPVKTFLAGELIADQDGVLDKPNGKVIRRVISWR